MIYIFIYCKQQSVISEIIYTVSSAVYIGVIIKQIRIILDSKPGDRYYWGKVMFFVFNMCCICGFGLLIVGKDKLAAAIMYFFLSLIAFWTYYSKNRNI